MFGKFVLQDITMLY